MDSIELIRNLCKERGIAISQLEKDCGFSNGYIRGLRRGVLPGDRAKIVADYFGISLEYLLSGGINENESSSLSSNQHDITNDIENLIKIMEHGKGDLFYKGEKIDSESIELLCTALEMGIQHLNIMKKEKNNTSKNDNIEET